MGMGLRRGGRRGRRRAGRRRRRVGHRLGHRLRRRRRYRRGRGGGAVNLFACCFGAQPKDHCQMNEEDLLAMEKHQNQMLQMISMQQQEMLAMGAAPPGAPQQPPQPAPGVQQQMGVNPGPSMDAEMAEDARELQEAQQELLNDILKQQADEKDPERLQALFRQQNALLQQMHQFQNAGFQYANGIPPPQEPPPYPGTGSAVPTSQEPPPYPGTGSVVPPAPTY